MMVNKLKIQKIKKFKNRLHVHATYNKLNACIQLPRHENAIKENNLYFNERKSFLIYTKRKFKLLSNEYNILSRL